MEVIVNVSPLTSQASVDDLINIRNAAQGAASSAAGSAGIAGQHKAAAEQANTTAAEQAVLAGQHKAAAEQANTTADEQAVLAGEHSTAASQSAQRSGEYAADAETREASAAQHANFAQAQANAATLKAGESASHTAESLNHRTAAAAEALKAKQSAEDAAAVVSGGTASLAPTAGKIPLANAGGVIDLNWLGKDNAARIKMASVRVNDIGQPGTIGYGVGICPEIPAGYTALPGTFTLGSDEYGNYQYSEGSVTGWVPAYYARIGHPDNPTYAAHGVNSIHTEPLRAFTSRAAAEAAGYMLPRAFIDGGRVQAGFMHDKYRCSNNGGIASSLKNGNPLSSSAAHNPFSGLTGAPPNNYSGAIQAAKTRGAQFFPASRFMRVALTLLHDAHAQASTSASHNAWWDAAAVTNFVKGCNNNALGDTNDASVKYTSDGYENCGQTGSGTPFAKTTHNGQACGIADLNGNMYTIELGLTCVAEAKTITAATKTNPVGLTIAAHGITTGQPVMVLSVGGMTELNSKIFKATVIDADTISLDGVDGTAFAAYTTGGSITFGTFYTAKESTKMEEFTGGNTLATDHWGAVGVAENMQPIDLGLRTDYPNNGTAIRYGNAAEQVLSSAAAGDDWLNASLGMPLPLGVSPGGTSRFGNDYFYQYIRNELCVISGFTWLSGSHAGPWAVYLLHSRTHSSFYAGFASASYPVTLSDSEGAL